jgi:5-methyltetrahydropteroyltriglutamate--homocysteine methyltransferase
MVEATRRLRAKHANLQHAGSRADQGETATA